LIFNHQSEWRHFMKSLTVASALWVAGALLSAAPVFAAESTALQTQVRQTDALTVQHGTTQVESRIAGDFTTFAGSEVNAQSLVTGLRNGTPVKLTSTLSGGGTPTTTTLSFDNPTRPMGYGNVHIGLSLARQQLASYGINDPTPQEIQSALTGGSITSSSGRMVTLSGVLTQRAAGMGWGGIAQAQGVKLGQVIGGLKTANARIATGTSATATAGAGITTATGVRAQASSTAAADPAHRNSAHAFGHNRNQSAGSGIVTAAGSRPAAGAGIGVGTSANSGGLGAGIVTGTGNSASVQGGARGALMGKGHAKP
jgi:hypothetical protein